MPAHAQSGAITQPLAAALIRFKAMRDLLLPLADETVAAIDAYVAANAVQKPDIWRKRGVSLDGRDDLAPDVLATGAVDRAGDETGFTSHGRLVRVHANGHRVHGGVPGGKRQLAPGTSMAPPQVTKLAPPSCSRSVPR